MILTKICRSNKSLIITIPRDIVRELSLKTKDYLSVTSEDGNKLCFRKVTVTPSQVFVDGENVTKEVAEPFIDLDPNQNDEEDKPNW